MTWVVQILLTDQTYVLHGPFNSLENAERYAREYVEHNPRVGSQVMALHRPHGR